ncbi:MAG: YiiX/YebB-like N1pC/P60 family cysteine hydrolase [Gammaproteobacteria bacterium]|nr:YiiX/YebB-like N1pC/P60 family cysteine hydrolase [Gammaproteobacteria bacterium]
MKRLVTVTAGIAVVAVAAIAINSVRLSINDSKRATACYAQLGETLESGVDPVEVFHSKLEDLQLLVELSLVARSEMLVISNRLQADQDSPLSSRDLVTLKSGTEAYLGMREELYDIANAYECAVDAEPELLEAFDISPQLRLKALMLSLGAALTLYDNYLIGAVHFEQDDRLRRLINDPDMGFGLVANKLAEATLAANSVEIRHRARRAIEFYEEQKSLFADSHEDSDEAYLMQLIESSPSYNYVRKIRIGEIAGNKFQAFERIAVDRTAEGAAASMDVLSGLFGNSVGLYESRKGKLYGDDEALEHIQSRLQPLDILLEKTPFRLTDKLIPGHFGHVAIWTGTQAELIDAGVWDELLVKQYAGSINSERRIIEALRSGVQLNPLEEFLNVDDFAVLRPVFNEKTRQEDTREALLMAFRQVGKKYDFNFDVNTTDKIVCSELAYISFPVIDWPTEAVLGRHSISPDNVAQMAWNNVPLRLVMFYHDGELVPEDEQVEKMRELMLN